MLQTLVKHSDLYMFIHQVSVVPPDKYLKNTSESASSLLLTTTSQTHVSIHVSTKIMLHESVCVSPVADQARFGVTGIVSKDLWILAKLQTLAFMSENKKWQTRCILHAIVNIRLSPWRHNKSTNADNLQYKRTIYLKRASTSKRANTDKRNAEHTFFELPSSHPKPQFLENAIQTPHHKFAMMCGVDSHCNLPASANFRLRRVLYKHEFVLQITGIYVPDVCIDFQSWTSRCVVCDVFYRGLWGSCVIQQARQSDYVL